MVMACGRQHRAVLFFGWGIEQVASGLAGVLNATTLLFTLAFVVAAHAERLSVVRVSGLLLGFVGVVFLTARCAARRLMTPYQEWAPACWVPPAMLLPMCMSAGS